MGTGMTSSAPWVWARRARACSTVFRLRCGAGVCNRAMRRTLRQGTLLGTPVTAGSSRQRTFDGTTREVAYTPGETRHFSFAKGEYLLHDLENIGGTELIFTTVEFKGSANAPLPLD